MKRKEKKKKQQNFVCKITLECCYTTILTHTQLNATHARVSEMHTCMQVCLCIHIQRKDLSKRFVYNIV